MKVTVVVNCCYEGRLLSRALDSAFRSVEASGFAEECEVIAVADNPEPTTAQVLRENAGRLSRIVHTDVADLGLARNAGAAAGQGTLVMFLDADDLWSPGWVGAAWREHLEVPGLTVLHPQYSAFFGARSELLIHADWRDPGFDPRGLVARNAWTSACCLRRDLLAEHPFPQADCRTGFGFEDWSWYRRTVAHGIRHVTVPGTTHFIRVKAIASMQQSMLGFSPIPSLAFAEFLADDDPTRPPDL